MKKIFVFLILLLLSMSVVSAVSDNATMCSASNSDCIDLKSDSSYVYDSQLLGAESKATDNIIINQRNYKMYFDDNNVLKKDYTPKEGYSLIGKYTGMQNKVLMKHNLCGFIWEVKPSNLENGKGCPKCNRKISKGEQKIIKWLENNHINYTPQKKIDIEGHHLSCDFYLEDYDLYIEYNGEQHYNPIAFHSPSKKDRR